MAQIRLDKFLSSRTAHSRADIKKLLHAGAVCIDGSRETDGSRKLDPEVHIVTCQGKTVRTDEHVYFIVNKPQGFVCATKDREHPVVTELIPREQRVRGLFPAGRLDGDSTGLVLVTDDGALAHRMLSPKHHVPKYYLVQLARPCGADDSERFAAGITLSDGTHCLPAEIMPLEVPGNFVLIALHEGKYHQVKRMAAAVGNHVAHLHRVAVGAMILPPNLALGGHLEILHKDVEKLLKPGNLPDLSRQIVASFSSYLINEGQ